MKIAGIDLGDKPLFLAPMEDVTDPEQIVATLDEIARVWGDYDASEIVPKPLSHEV